jgi:hypothetical protein
MSLRHLHVFFVSSTSTAAAALVSYEPGFG